MAEWIELWVGERAGDEVEGEIEVGEREVGEEELDELVNEFDVEEDLATNCMIGMPDLTEMDE